eukprot:856691-Pelagomonas_calceolata.AAC.5
MLTRAIREDIQLWCTCSVQATCLHLDPSPPPTMVELLRERRPDQVRWIATLCNAANNIASSIEIHHEKGAEQKAFYENLDSNVVMVCHCTTFAIMWYASLIRAGQTMRDVDASPSRKDLAGCRNGMAQNASKALNYFCSCTRLKVKAEVKDSCYQPVFVSVCMCVCVRACARASKWTNDMQ